MSKQWKNVELAVAKALGGRRAGAVGAGGPDILDCDPYAPEVKHGKAYRLPKWFHEAWAQAEMNAPEHLVPMLVIHERGTEILDSFVVLRLREFRDWYVGTKK